MSGKNTVHKSIRVDKSHLGWIICILGTAGLVLGFALLLSTEPEISVVSYKVLDEDTGVYDIKYREESHLPQPFGTYLGIFMFISGFGLFAGLWIGLAYSDEDEYVDIPWR